MAEALQRQELAEVKREIAKVEAKIEDPTITEEEKRLWRAVLLELMKTKINVWDMVAAVRQAVRAEFDAQLPANEIQPFSGVSKSAAYGLLGKLDITAIDGSIIAEDELKVPKDTDTCGDFTWSSGDENTETPALLRHHKHQLERLGVRFGRDGYAVYDVHSYVSDGLTIQVGNKEYEGIFDGCVAPYGLMDCSAITQCRIVYVHIKPPGTLDECEGQAIMVLLAANAYAPSPVLLDCTDGVIHNLYALRGGELIRWKGLAPTTAYYMQARHLQSLPNLSKRSLTLDEVPEPQQGWMRRLRLW
ncbi:hypothetical protein GPECTOR_54g231 [Gonium pectorale]|uniref:Uncharacterized protein n=1 Tax=Gonium pectorale TaxID=33097 RepID=A0A150G810_GONPE|nr:hypothetical protein GPECTOR_54g231 [Gonium pectorale]|eukprot:KXZ45490.1 hypothetical protein GPECTOR_54g231 [Gonium pectorale]